MARDQGALLIVDEIQTGCGRTGSFFAFEKHGIVPDIIILAKSLSGYGLPISMMLLKPEFDLWKPDEHNGTFRGNNHAFVTARVALNKFWADDRFEHQIQLKAARLSDLLSSYARDNSFEHRGFGLMQGLKLGNSQFAAQVKKAAFDRGLIIELCGPDDEVIKFMPPLNISEKDLFAGVQIVKEAIDEVASSMKHNFLEGRLAS